MNKHLVVIYFALALLAFFSFFKGNGGVDVSSLTNRITKVEFFQEATRIRDNLIGFKQVNATLANNSERAKNCTESKDLLAEWNEDTKKLGIEYAEYLKNNQEANEYFEAINKLNTTIASECSK